MTARSGRTRASARRDRSSLDGDRRLAARAFLAPPHFESGHALFIRRDLLERYASSLRREVVLVVRGERQPDYELVRSRPRWYLNVVRSNADEWAFGRRLSDLG